MSVRKITTEHAVSPVVGVMLMLVVVIIIAAVVSAGAGSIAGSHKMAAKTTVIEADFSAKGLLHLKNMGSNPIQTQDCTFRLTLDNQKFPLNYSIFWMMNEQNPEIVKTIQPQQTVMWGGVVKTRPGVYAAVPGGNRENRQT